MTIIHIHTIYPIGPRRDLERHTSECKSVLLLPAFNSIDGINERIHRINREISKHTHDSSNKNDILQSIIIQQNSQIRSLINKVNNLETTVQDLRVKQLVLENKQLQQRIDGRSRL